MTIDELQSRYFLDLERCIAKHASVLLSLIYNKAIYLPNEATAYDILITMLFSNDVFLAEWKRRHNRFMDELADIDESEVDAFGTVEEILADAEEHLREAYV
jgi:hypothetical protein